MPDSVWRLDFGGAKRDQRISFRLVYSHGTSAIKAAAETEKPRQILSSLYSYMFLPCEYAIALGVLEHISVRD